MNKETFVTSKRVELMPGHHDSQIPTADMDDGRLRALADHYRNFGDGTIDLVVTYDPESRGNNTAREASAEASRMASALRRAGVRDVVTDIMPVSGQGSESRTLISYSTVTAHEPAGCRSMGGVDGNPMEYDVDYEQGCTIEMMIARQVARPRDLKGNDGMDEALSGRREGNVIERYKTGTPNEALDVYTTSD